MATVKSQILNQLANNYPSFLKKDLIKLIYIILKEMEKLLFKPQSDIHRGTASYYILIAFVEISSECAQAMPWLIQY